MIKNLREALEGVLARHLAAHRNGLAEKSSTTPLLAEHPRLPPKLSPKEAHQKQARREERLALYNQVVALRKLGFSQTAIANQIGIGHATVSRWLGSGTFPEQQPRARRTHLDPHLPFLRERWEAGCHTIAQLYRELVARGYTHSYELVQQFAQMLRTRTGEYLDAWLEQARASQIREVQSFVLGIERDKAAVFAGLTLPHSNGIVEGKVNKLKLIKRMGYGRAGFPLLRQRVLHAL